MPANIIKSFADKSNKSETEIEKLWNELKNEYGEDYQKIVGTLKKILNINEEAKGTYVSVKLKNHKELSKWFQEQGLETIPSEEMHCTIAYSRKEFQHKVKEDDIYIKPDDFIEIAPLGNNGCLVLKYKSEELQNRFNQCMDEGAAYDYPKYIPHCTIAIDIKDEELINYLKLPNFPMVFHNETVEELDLDWKNKITKEKEMQVKEETYKEFFAKKLEKFGVKSPSELSDEDKTKFYDEVDAEWEGEKEEIEEEGCENKDIKEEVDLATKAIYELSKGNTTEFISIVKDAMFVSVGANEKYPNKD